MLVELATVVDEEERRLTRGYDRRRWRWFQLAVRNQRLLQLQQLAHKVQVRRDDRTGQLHHLVRFQQRNGLVPHDVGYRDCSATADSGLTVQQHGRTSFPGLLDKIESLLEVLLDVLVWRIAGRDLLVVETRLQYAVGRLLAGNVQNTVGSHGGRVNGVPAVPEQQEGKHWRCGMRFNVIGHGRTGTATGQRYPGSGRDR